MVKSNGQDSEGNGRKKHKPPMNGASKPLPKQQQQRKINKKQATATTTTKMRKAKQPSTGTPHLLHEASNGICTVEQMRDTVDHMLYVLCELDGHPCEMLIDSGASSSAISSSMVHKLGLKHKLSPQIAGNVSGVGSTKILGVIENVHCNIGQGLIEFRLYFMVLESTIPILILGLDQMRRYKCIIDLDDNVLRFGGKDGVVGVPFLSKELASQAAMTSGMVQQINENEKLQQQQQQQQQQHALLAQQQQLLIQQQHYIQQQLQQQQQRQKHRSQPQQQRSSPGIQHQQRNGNQNRPTSPQRRRQLQQQQQHPPTLNSQLRDALTNRHPSQRRQQQSQQASTTVVQGRHVVTSNPSSSGRRTGSGPNSSARKKLFNNIFGKRK